MPSPDFCSQAPRAPLPSPPSTHGERLRLLREGFGLRWVSHRIGEQTLRVAEVREVDRCVEALYPQCLVDHGDAPVWMISWPAAFALAEHLLLERTVAGLDVLELGCGTAVPGVAAALGGARVRATDYDEYALAVARENARENGVVDLELGDLDWYRPRLDRRYPLVVGSEITYHEVAFDPLEAVLAEAVAPGGRVLLSDIYREQSGRFLDRCRRRGWTVREHRRVVHLPAESRAVRIAELSPHASRAQGQGSISPSSTATR